MKRNRLTVVAIFILVAVLFSTAFAMTIPAATTTPTDGVQLGTSIAKPIKPSASTVVPESTTPGTTTPTDTTPVDQVQNNPNFNAPLLPTTSQEAWTLEDVNKVAFFDTERENLYLFAEPTYTIKVISCKVISVIGNSVIMEEITTGHAFGFDYTERPNYQVNDEVTLYVLIMP